MVKLSQLPKVTSRTKKRVGRGYGSGRGGHTVGRGAKGQKARGKVKIGFEGGQTSLIQRLPLRRGRGKLPISKKPLTVNVKYLNLLPKDSKVTIETLLEHGIVDKGQAQKLGVKILGDGELKIPLEVNLPCSKGAVKKIEKAGGKVKKNG